MENILDCFEILCVSDSIKSQLLYNVKINVKDNDKYSQLKPIILKFRNYWWTYTEKKNWCCYIRPPYFTTPVAEERDVESVWLRLSDLLWSSKWAWWRQGKRYLTHGLNLTHQMVCCTEPSKKSSLESVWKRKNTSVVLVVRTMHRVACMIVYLRMWGITCNQEICEFRLDF